MTPEEIRNMPAEELRTAIVAYGLFSLDDPRDPTKDISAAWEIVEKSIQEYDFCLYPIYSKSHNSWIIDFDYLSEYIPKRTVQAETAPLAICRAALLMVTK